jgi:hypothetical protein
VHRDGVDASAARDRLDSAAQNKRFFSHLLGSGPLSLDLLSTTMNVAIEI